MKRTSTRLADGRELVYYDEQPADRSRPDRRELAATQVASEVRYDPLLGEWVAIASHRQGRTHLPPTDECPLCPSTDARDTEIPAHDYDVVVFENRFPSFAARAESGPEPPADDAPFRSRPGVGRCEVVCFSADHNASFVDLPVERVRTIIEAWADRTAALSATPGVEQVFVFENRGAEIGVTLNHPHGQIYGYPFVTPRTSTMLERAREHRAEHGGNLFAERLQAEQRAGERVVTTSEHWTAFVPFAARWPVELHLYPHRQVPDLSALEPGERDDLARVYLDLLRRLDGIHGVAMPYIAGWQQAPVNADRDLTYAHLQLFSIRRAPNKLKYLAGSESAMGAFINDITPEQIATSLRNADAAG